MRWLALLLVLILPAVAHATTGDRVLVLYNTDYTRDEDGDTVQDSLECANYYAAARNVPASNVRGEAFGYVPDAYWRLVVSTTEAAWTPAKASLKTYMDATDVTGQAPGTKVRDHVYYIVVCIGVPKRTDFTRPASPSQYSNGYPTTELLEDLYDDAWTAWTGSGHSTTPMTNPIYAANQRISTYRAANPTMQIYAASLLDGPTIQDVKNMIDAAIYATTYFDKDVVPWSTSMSYTNRCVRFDDPYYTHLLNFDTQIGTAGLPHTLTPASPSYFCYVTNDLAGTSPLYFNSFYIRDRDLFGGHGVTGPTAFVPGSIATAIWSCAGCTFDEATDAIIDPSSEASTNSSAGAYVPNGVILGAFLRNGATAGAGASREPFADIAWVDDALAKMLNTTPRWDYGEAMSFARRNFQCCNFVVGDPLMSYPAEGSAATDNVAPALDGSVAFAYWKDTARVTWSTVNVSMGTFKYILAASGNVGDAGTVTINLSGYSKRHRAYVTGLAAGIYNYKVAHTNPSGSSTVTEAQGSFTVPSYSDASGPYIVNALNDNASSGVLTSSTGPNCTTFADGGAGNRPTSEISSTLGLDGRSVSLALPLNTFGCPTTSALNDEGVIEFYMGRTAEVGSEKEIVRDSQAGGVDYMKGFKFDVYGPSTSHQLVRFCVGGVCLQAFGAGLTMPIGVWAHVRLEWRASPPVRRIKLNGVLVASATGDRPFEPAAALGTYFLFGDTALGGATSHAGASQNAARGGMPVLIESVNIHDRISSNTNYNAGNIVPIAVPTTSLSRTSASSGHGMQIGPIR